MAEAVRVDKWLWAVRVYKSRGASNDACRDGKVRVDGEPAKPSTKVRVGQRVEARRRDRTIIYEVVQPLEKRVSATLAAAAVVDHSPALITDDFGDPVVGRRERGAGRPTKKDRRSIDRLRGRE